MKRIVAVILVVLALLLLFMEGGSGPIVSQNGIAINQFADETIGKYDRNQNGTLEVAEESFLRDTSDRVVAVESRGLLFADADQAGNGNGIVTSEELMDYLEQFDEDSDGELTTYKNVFHSIRHRRSEWREFELKYGERFDYKEIEE